MDRDKRWERIKVAYDMLVKGVGKRVEEKNLINEIQEKYELLCRW
jgi:2,3-bisphosphoglycerate-independent phosphoglycerate mutase